MARLKIAATILAAAEKWKQRCLLEDGSLFSEQRLWTRENFGELQTCFVERPDEGSDSFAEKLRRQLDPAPPEAKRLWAEMTWVYYLIASSVKRVTKLDRIRTVWEWSGAALPEDHWALGEVLDGGMVNPGMAYLNHQWREFRFIITMMLDWNSRSARERETLLNDPWGFAEWVDGQEDSHRRQFRHALLFLLFPGEFESIVSRRHKKDIVKAFREEIGETYDVDRMNLTELDRALLAVRRRLEGEHPGKEIYFYEPSLRERWDDDDSTTPGNNGQIEKTDHKTWFQKRFGMADVWAIAPGEGARLWRDFQEHGIAAIGYDELGDLSDYDSKDAIHSALIENGALQNPINHSLAVWEFVHEIKNGDILIAKRGRKTILAWGEVTGDYTYEPERPEYRNLRKVEWHPCRSPINLEDPITTKTLTRFTSYKNWLRDVFKLIDEPPENGPDGKQPYDIPAAIVDLFLEETQFRRILDSIALRKNLILQGPPGVGKTFIARRIAWCLMGRKDSRPIEMVQFHQSYAYEDFVQGWRPTETGGFRLRNGVFYEFCKRAEQQPDTPFVFIIDEINRGNLSRIFGELLMLIEADKRGPGHAIALTYGAPGERFSVPENVHVLGLMNTADRSLAIVDYALRRRFAFETLKPAYGTGKFREYLLEAEVDKDLVDRIDRNLSALNERIRDDKDLGPGFQIGHSYFVPEGSADEQWYLSIVDTQIAPLLREYWFDRPEQVDKLVEDLRR
ncbi:MAG: AAA family ATPase [Nitrospinae bacterium]|nr:AAA family ATPase [Nitrospinota bacterium]